MLSDTNATRSSLMLRLAAGDPEAWREWVVIYLPMIERWARRFGVRADYVDDVVTDLVEKLYRGAENFVYDRKKGRYRDYLKRVAFNGANDWLKTTSRQAKTYGKADGSDPISMVADTAAGESLLGEFVEGHRLFLFRQAEQQTRDESSHTEWECYYQSVYSMPKRKPLEIAESLGIKIGNYYKCKCVFLKLLKKNFDKLDQ